MTLMARVLPGSTAWRKPSSTAGTPQAAWQKSSRRKANEIVRACNKSGRLTGIFSPDGTSQRTGYDERGLVNVTTQGRRAIEYHYPDEHTVIRRNPLLEDECDRHPDESLLKTTYRYNAAGELTEVILPGMRR